MCSNSCNKNRHMRIECAVIINGRNGRTVHFDSVNGRFDHDLQFIIANLCNIIVALMIINRDKYLAMYRSLYTSNLNCLLIFVVSPH